MNFMVNKSLLPLKGYYFLLMSAFAAILPYLPIFAQSIGITIQEVALVYGIFPVLIIITNPLIGAVADKLQNHKLVLIILIILQVGFTLPLYYFPKINFKSATQLGLKSNQTGLYLSNPNYYLDVTKNITNSSRLYCNFTCQLPNDYNTSLYNEEINFLKDLLTTSQEIIFYPYHFTFGININDFQFTQSYYNDTQCNRSLNIACTALGCSEEVLIINSSKHHDGIHYTFQFLLFLFFRIISEICSAAGIGIGDAITLEKLKERPNEFGKTRLMGSLGYGIGSAIFGKLNDLQSEGENHYGVGFFSFAGLLVLSFCVLAVFSKATIPPKPKSLRKDLVKLFLVPQISGFIVMLAFDGMSHSLLSTFNFWYMKELGASHLAMGMSIFIMCLSEIVFFYFSSYIIKKLGNNNIMYIVFLTWSLRLTIYTFITNPWMFLLVDLLHGICFALFYANMSSFAKQVAPQGTLATTQELFLATFLSIGGSIGNLIGGFSYHIYGAVRTYRGFAVGMLLACISYIIFNLILDKTKWKNLIKNQVDVKKSKDMTVPDDLVLQSSPFLSVQSEIEKTDGQLTMKDLDINDSDV